MNPQQITHYRLRATESGRKFAISAGGGTPPGVAANWNYLSTSGKLMAVELIYKRSFREASPPHERVSSLGELEYRLAAFPDIG